MLTSLALALRRTVFPFFLFVATAWLVYRYTYPLPQETGILLWLSRTDPLLLASEFRFAHTLPPWFWLPACTLILTLLFGRIFCGWFCPVGGLLNLIHILRGFWLKQLSVRPALPATHFSFLYQIRYAWLGFLLALLLLGSNWPLFFTPYHFLSQELTALFLGNIPWLLSAVIALAFFAFPRFWCVFICPTGLLLSVLSYLRPIRLRINEKCVHCNACEQHCPMQTISPIKNRIHDDCVLCQRCRTICPSDAVNYQAVLVPSTTSTAASGGFGLTRRQFVLGAMSVSAATLSFPLTNRQAAELPLRPPGALPEADFLARCSRCGRCMKACSGECLKPMSFSAGLAGFLTPHITPRDTSCQLCLQCQDVCPTGAIVHKPLSDIKMGLAKIDETTCLMWKQGTICLLCQEQCPVQAIQPDERNRPVVQESTCVGCGACQHGCPLEQSAVTVTPLERNK